MKTKYFLTENGNILNVEKGCFQTPTGQFLRRVFKNEMEYLTKELTPVRFPKGIEQPELPIWTYLWDVEGEYEDEYGDTHECIISCFTRQIEGLKREFSVLYVPKYYYPNVRIVDANIDVFVEDYENEDGVGELATYAQKVSILTIWTLGEPDLSERVRRYKVLKSMGIKLPYAEHLEWLKRRKRKVARKRATV
jgi:hypothetical protein